MEESPELLLRIFKIHNWLIWACRPLKSLSSKHFKSLKYSGEDSFIDSASIPNVSLTTLLQVDFFQTYIIELQEREGSPLYAVEHFIEGGYIKYNSNSGFVSDINRLTPQTFSHFTFEKSNHQLIVVDIQGTYCAGNFHRKERGNYYFNMRGGLPAMSETVLLYSIHTHMYIHVLTCNCLPLASHSLQIC